MERITLIIDGSGFVLDDRSDVSEIKDRIAHAARTGPAFVDFATIGGTASALIGPGTRVVVTTEAVPEVELEPEAPHDALLAWSLDFAVDASFGWEEPSEAGTPETPQLRPLNDGRPQRMV